MITIRSDSQTTIKFELNIAGSDAKPKTYFVIEKPDYDVSFPCDVGAEYASVSLPKLTSIVAPGQYPIRLDVRIEDRIYTPLNDVVQVQEPISTAAKINAAEAAVESVVASSIKVEQTKDKEQLIRLLSATIGESEAIDFSSSFGSELSDLDETDLQKINEILDHVSRTRNKK